MKRIGDQILNWVDPCKKQMTQHSTQCQRGCYRRTWAQNSAVGWSWRIKVQIVGDNPVKTGWRGTLRTKLPICCQTKPQEILTMLVSFLVFVRNNRIDNRSWERDPAVEKRKNWTIQIGTKNKAIENAQSFAYLSHLALSFFNTFTIALLMPISKKAKRGEFSQINIFCKFEQTLQNIDTSFTDSSSNVNNA